MKAFDVKTLAMLAVCLSPSLAAAELEVVAAIGVLEPAGLQAGQQLDDKTRLRLEPWGRALVRETTRCGMTHVVVGMSEYVLTMSDECSETEDPLNVAARLQRGETFAARLQETGASKADALVAALKDDPCVFLQQVSEEGTAQRRCPSGYALRGLRCSGAHCDNKDLLCCPYLGGAPDETVKEKASRFVSEEFPNAVSSKLFVNGLSCRGWYCDDVLLQPFKSGRLDNAGSCDWTAWSSEQPGQWLDCGVGKLIAGIRCREQYCGDVGIHCCQAKSE